MALNYNVLRLTSMYRTYLRFILGKTTFLFLLHRLVFSFICLLFAIN